MGNGSHIQDFTHPQRKHVVGPVKRTAMHSTRANRVMGEDDRVAVPFITQGTTQRIDDLLIGPRRAR